MSRINVAVIVGSLRKDSINAKLADALARLAPLELALTPVSIADLPLYNPDDEGTPNAAVAAFRAAIGAAQAVLFVTPEYNRSIPAPLKNALDTGSRPYGKSVWAGKPAAVAGISPGALGTALAQVHLRAILGALDMTVLPQPDVVLQMKDGLFDAEGNIGEMSHAYLAGWMAKFAAHAGRFG